jgi:hypothetical protein
VEGALSSKHLIPRLLSGKNRISRVEKDEIFQNVLRATAHRRGSWRWRGALLAVMAAAAGVVLIPVVLHDRDDRDSEFAPRGQGAAVATFGISCDAKLATTCKRGDKLVFDLSQASGYRYFASFSRREDGTIIWYFPQRPEGESLDLHRRLTAGVIDLGVVLGEHHRPGRYRVYGVFSDRPLTRRMLRARFDEKAAGRGLDSAVVTRELVVK